MKLYFKFISGLSITSLLFSTAPAFALEPVGLTPIDVDKAPRDDSQICDNICNAIIHYQGAEAEPKDKASRKAQDYFDSAPIDGKNGPVAWGMSGQNDDEVCGKLGPGTKGANTKAIYKYKAPADSEKDPTCAQIGLDISQKYLDEYFAPLKPTKTYGAGEGDKNQFLADAKQWEKDRDAHNRKRCENAQKAILRCQLKNSQIGNHCRAYKITKDATLFDGILAAGDLAAATVCGLACTDPTQAGPLPQACKASACILGGIELTAKFVIQNDLSKQGYQKLSTDEDWMNLAKGAAVGTEALKALQAFATRGKAEICGAGGANSDDELLGDANNKALEDATNEYDAIDKMKAGKEKDDALKNYNSTWVKTNGATKELKTDEIAAERIKSKKLLDQGLACAQAAVFAATGGVRAYNVGKFVAGSMHSCGVITSLASSQLTKLTTGQLTNNPSKSGAGTSAGGSGASTGGEGYNDTQQSIVAYMNALNKASGKQEYKLDSDLVKNVMDTAAKESAATAMSTKVPLLRDMVSKALESRDANELTNTLGTKGPGAMMATLGLTSKLGSYGGALMNFADSAYKNGDALNKIFGAELGPGFGSGSLGDTRYLASTGSSSPRSSNPFDTMSLGSFGSREPAGGGTQDLNLSAAPKADDIWHEGSPLNLFQIVSGRIEKTTPRMK
jgi:hypothetical protein